MESCSSRTKNIVSPLMQCPNQIWQGGDLSWQPPTYEVTWPFDHVFFRDLMTNKKSLYFKYQCLWPWNLAECWLTLRRSYLKSHIAPESRGFLKSRKKIKTYLNYHNAFGTVVSYHEGLPPVMSHDSLITWSSEITGKTKIIVFPLWQCLWRWILAGWWLTLSASNL